MESYTWKSGVELYIIMQDLWDYTIVTDRHLCHNRPDIVLSYLQQKKIYLIDISIPGDSRLVQKSVEKWTKYRDLQIEEDKMWQTSSRTVSVIIGALGSIPSDLLTYLSTVNLPISIVTMMQKSVLLCTARMLRRYLS